MSMINLSPKAVRFLIETLEFRIVAYQAQLKEPDLNEDDASDLMNDMMFLESLLQEFQKMKGVSIPQVF